jgi:hypothetical protein
MARHDWKCHECGSVTINCANLCTCLRCGSPDGHPASKPCKRCADLDANSAMAGRFDDEVRRMDR